MEIKLELTLAEVNMILEALGNQPYAKVYSLVTKIQQQASQQLDQQSGENVLTPSS